mmetsp:Transcript_72351/g.228062  ORF Transcript_72351/g.228062 Transcript_72351/m.228062 type:complete len:205 (-) Transcript_72351:65-679(-)
MLLMCQHPTISGLITRRHDAAVHLILAAIEAGEQGNWHTHVNAGTRHGRPCERTIKPWMLIDTLQKPDIVVVQKLVAGATPLPGSPHRRPYDLQLVEVCYATDYHPYLQAAAARKERTYDGLPTGDPPVASLCDRLRQAGWKVDLQVITLGCMAGIPMDLIEKLAALGVTGGLHQGPLGSARPGPRPPPRRPGHGPAGSPARGA